MAHIALLRSAGVGLSPFYRHIAPLERKKDRSNAADASIIVEAKSVQPMGWVNPYKFNFMFYASRLTLPHVAPLGLWVCGDSALL